MLMAFNAGFGGPTSGNPLHTPAALGFLLMGFCTSSVWVVVQHKLCFVLH